MEHTTPIQVEERKRLAALIGCSEQYLYRCLTGRQDMTPKDAVRAEQLTQGRLTRASLRPNDYWLVWPDLPAPASAGA
jgi:DNA-binding transcriptional regulator YdaS (Cro superfamily)